MPAAFGNRRFEYEGDGNQSTTDKESAPKLRTFRGWKRDTTHLDKSRLTKGLMRVHVSDFSSLHSIGLLSCSTRCQVNPL